MDDHSWMYRDLPKGLCMMEYCNEIHGFINYILSNMRNISRFTHMLKIIISGNLKAADGCRSVVVTFDLLN